MFKVIQIKITIYSTNYSLIVTFILKLKLKVCKYKVHNS